jgi:membrane-bound lytic murein transglycosylase D
MRYNGPYKHLLWTLVLLWCYGATTAQVISTNHSINAQAQLILHMDGLESSWEVMNARAQAPNKALGVTSLTDLPSDEVLATEMRYLLGDVKLELSQRIKEYILLFARNRRSSTEAMLGVASIYAPVIERKIIEMRMPPVLGLLPAALSAFHLRAISEDGAAGLWQLNYYVATKQGLICNATVDERRDLYKSTKAALTYLEELQRGYGDWTMTLAAYTCGPAGITRARNRAGANARFEQLYPFLPEPGRDFVPAFAAAAYVMTHAQQLGLRPLAMEAMPLPDRIQLREPLRFSHVAHALGIPENELRNLNPVCRTEIIPGINIPVQLCLPQGYGQRFALIQDSIYLVQLRMEAKRLEPKADATSGETNEPPKPKPVVAAPKPYAPPAGTVPLSYTIKSGDNVGLIAQWYGIGTKELRDMNGLTSDRIKAGDKLTIHVPKAKAATLGKIDGMSFDEKQALVGGTAAAPVPKPVPAPATGTTTWHTVKSGENLWVIAKKYPGVTAEAIMKANGIGEKLQPGMKLKIPKVSQ